MVKCLFVHDHKFPKYSNDYFNSYGFDSEFFLRYKNMFDSFNIIGREVKCDMKYTQKNREIDKNVNLYTIKSYKKLFDKNIRYDIKNRVRTNDFLIIRLPSILGLYAIYLAKKNNKPYVIELVGCPWDAYWNMGVIKKILAPFMYVLTKKVIKNSKYIIYVTNNFLQSRYPSNGKTISVSNVTIRNVENISLEDRKLRIENFDIQQKLKLGTIGTIDSLYKGQQYVIKAIKKLKRKNISVEYHLVGGGSTKYLKKIAKKNNVTNEVKFHGRLLHNDIFYWLKTIDLYIQPSDTEGLPRSVIEAMSVACPIIGSNAGGIPELIDKSFIFKKGDTNQIVKMISNLTKDNLLKMSVNNFENSKRYLTNILYDKRTSFYNNFINSELGEKK